jgi:hypothetical protein
VGILRGHHGTAAEEALTLPSPEQSSPDTGSEPRRVGHLYRHHFRDPRRERLFLASVGFFVAFGITRIVVHAIRAGRGPFHDVEVGSTHIHHLVFGILILLLVGYLWLVEVGIRRGLGSRLTALAYGVGSALTLDEFALWLNLEDVYWQREGRESIDAVVLFGGFLSISLWGGPFFRGLWREAGRWLRTATGE